MDPREEAADLQQRPLPPQGQPLVEVDESILPSEVHRIDLIIEGLRDEIKGIENRIGEYQKIRRETMDRAIASGKLDDGQYVITRTVIEPTQRVDADLFRRTCPAEYLLLVWRKVNLAEMEAKGILDAETYLETQEDGTQLPRLKPDIPATLSPSQTDLKTVIKGKGAPDRIKGLLYRPGEATVMYKVERAPVVPCRS